MKHLAALLLLPGLITLTGCGGAAHPGTFTIAPDHYAQAFDAARNVLRDHRFDLARVDARSGVITTEPAASAGLATPWIDHTDTLGDATEGLLQHERRRVEVRFRPASIPESQAPGEVGAADIRESTESLSVHVTVLVERIYRPGRRPDATGVRLGSVALDPAAVADGSQPWFVSEDRADERLAGRLAIAIKSVLPEPSQPTQDH